MDNSYIRLYYLLGLIVAETITLILFARRTRKGISRKRVKENFLFLFWLTLIILIFNIIFYFFVEKVTVPLFSLLWILIGLVFAHIEFLIMKKRLYGNTIKNTFFIPSFIFVMIMSMVFSIIFLPFIDILDHHILRGKLLRFMVNFLFGYSSMLYWRFRRLEKTVGIIYFEKKILGFLGSKDRGKS